MTDRKNDSGVHLVAGPKSDVEPGSSRQLHPRGLHGRSDLDRHADALAALAGTVRRVFIR